METNKSTVKSFTNKQKVFVCRAVLLAPVVCILSIFLVLLICMEFTERSETVSHDNTCQTLNCTVQYKNGSLDASCIRGKVGNSTKMTDCFEVKGLCGSGDTRRSHGDSSWKDFRFCLHNLTKFGLLQDGLVQNATNYIRELFSKNGTFMNCSFNKAKVGTTACNVNSEKETAKQKLMKRNTRIADTVLVVLLSLGLLVFILMSVYTRKTLKVCCHMCYMDE